MDHVVRPPLSHPPAEEIDLTAVLRALGDPTRLQIVRTLYADPAGRACGTFEVDVAPSTLSHHFKVLREAGVIAQEERGVRRWTTLRAADLDERFPGLLASVVAAG